MSKSPPRRTIVIFATSPPAFDRRELFTRSETTRKIKTDTLTGQSLRGVVWLRGAELRPARTKRPRYKWIARKFVQRQRGARARLDITGKDSKKDGIFAPRNSVKNDRKSCRAAKCRRRKGREKRWKHDKERERERKREERGNATIEKCCGERRDGGAIRLSPIKYCGSVQNISVVFRIFLRRVRWRLPLKRAR